MLLPLLGCVLWGAPKTELPSEPLQPAALTAFEKQRASVRLQMSRIAEAQARRVTPSAQASLEKQRAAAERQRRSVERQMLAVRPEPAVYTAPAYTAPARVVAAATWTGAADAGCERIPPPQISNYLESVAERESLDPDLLHVVIAQESSFFPCAVSHKGAMGMMQLMPATAADLGVTNPFDAKENIDGGARYLGYLLQRFGGDLKLALAAYNAGPTRVDNYRGVPPFPETVDYVSRIMGRLPAMPKPVPLPTIPGTT
ncbi:MAG: lytic transglycosylase domain-containing protein [Bryobacterales bacterium]